MHIARKILMFAALWLFFEGMISLLATCDQVAEQASQHSGTQQAKKYCSALSGPILASGWAFLYWLGHILEGYGEAVIAVFTIVLAFATGLLWKATRDLVRGAEDTAQRQLRAYVDVTRAEIRDFTSQPKIFVVCKNSGQTPAYGVLFPMHVKLVQLPLQDEDLVPNPALEKRSIGTIGAGADAHNMTEMPQLSEERIIALKNGKSAIYVFGEILYRDIFRIERRTRYRMLCGGPFGVHPRGFMATDAEGNSAD